MLAVLKAYEDQTDLSNGATYWHGRDFGEPERPAYKLYYRAGFHFAVSIHDHWQLGDFENPTTTKHGSYTYAYISTAFYGGTTFMVHTEEYRTAQIPAGTETEFIGTLDYLNHPVGGKLKLNEIHFVCFWFCLLIASKSTGKLLSQIAKSSTTDKVILKKKRNDVYLT